MKEKKKNVDALLALFFSFAFFRRKQRPTGGSIRDSSNLISEAPVRGLLLPLRGGVGGGHDERKKQRKSVDAERE